VRVILLFTFAAAIALAIQTEVAFWFPISMLIPNLVLILVVDLGFRHHGIAAAIVAFAMGYALDTFSGSTLGMNAFLMTLVYLFCYQLSLRLLVMNSAVAVLTVFFCAMFAGIGAVAIGAHGLVLSRATPVLPQLLAKAAITAIVAPFVFALLSGVRTGLRLPAGPVRE
jgi:rod shape-determining protein MreD